MKMRSKDDMYRALVAFPQAESEGKRPNKEQWTRTQTGILDVVMRHYLSDREVKPYPDLMNDADEMYKRLHGGDYPTDMSDAADELNEAYGKDGFSFFTEKPRGMKRVDPRDAPSKHTGLYVYSRTNPDGWFSDYLYPIHHSYSGVDVNAAKLVHHGYGTMNDMLEVGDVDWESCFLPGVLFSTWDEVDEKSKAKVKPITHHHDLYERTLEGITSDADWAKFVSDTLMAQVGRHGVVAMVECRL